MSYQKVNLTEGRLEWAREHLPNIERPQVYFNPLVDWLKDRTRVLTRKLEEYRNSILRWFV